MDNIQFTKIRKGYILENSNIDKKVYLKFDKIKDISCGYTRVSKKNKGRNIINPQGELLWKEDKWFNMVGHFSEGFVRVYIEGKGWNYINTNGELLWEGDIWFNEAWDFQTDCVYDIIAKCARVRIDHRVEYLLTNGEIFKYNSYNPEEYKPYDIWTW